LTQLRRGSRARMHRPSSLRVSSSIGRVAVSKTVGWRFESFLARHILRSRCCERRRFARKVNAFLKPKDFSAPGGTLADTLRSERSAFGLPGSNPGERTTFNAARGSKHPGGHIWI